MISCEMGRATATLYRLGCCLLLFRSIFSSSEMTGARYGRTSFSCLLLGAAAPRLLTGRTSARFGPPAGLEPPASVRRALPLRAATGRLRRYGAAAAAYFPGERAGETGRD